MEDFGFAFNNTSFSDILLRIEILSHPPTASVPTSRKHVRQYGDVASDGNILNGSMGSLKVQLVTNFHACSPLLAAHSQYFYKLVKEGCGPLTIQIKDTEEFAIMEVLNYIYHTKISSTSAPDLMNILMVADKFGVSSCVEYCCKLLCNIAMDFKLALQCLDLRSRVTLPENLEPLTNAAKRFFLAGFKDITILQDEVMKLPLVRLEMILSVDNLCVGVEETVFSIVLKWAQSHYPEFEERKKILRSRLIPRILSPTMTLEGLTKIFVSNDLDQQHSEVIIEALCSNVGARYHRS